MSSRLPSPEIKLSSCLCFINANIILLLFIKFQVAADEAMTGGESDSGDSFLTLQLVLCIINIGCALKAVFTKVIRQRALHCSTFCPG